MKTAQRLESERTASRDEQRENGAFWNPAQITPLSHWGFFVDSHHVYNVVVGPIYLTFGTSGPRHMYVAPSFT